MITVHYLKPHLYTYKNNIPSNFISLVVENSMIYHDIERTSNLIIFSCNNLLFPDKSAMVRNHSELALTK